MALKGKLTAEEWKALPEGTRAFYVQEGEGYVLDTDLRDDITKLSGALEKERKDRATKQKELEGVVAKFKDVDPEKARAAMVELEELRQKEATKAGEFDTVRQQMLDKHNKDLSAKDKAIAAEADNAKRFRSMFESNLVENAALSAINKHKGVSALLLPHVKAAIKVTEEAGKFNLTVFDPEKGEAKVDGKGQPMSIDAYVEEMKGTEIFGRAFEGSGVSGAGSGANIRRGANGAHVISREDAHDRPKYLAAQEAAKKAGVELQIASEE